MRSRTDSRKYKAACAPKATPAAALRLYAALLIISGQSAFSLATAGQNLQALAQDAASAMPGDSFSAPSLDTSPMDPAGQPVVPFKSLTPDTFNSTVMSIFGTTDTTPQAGYGAPSPDSINGGAGPGGFISPPAGSTGGSTAGISTGGAAIRGFTGFSNSAADLGAAAGDSAANAAAAAAATLNKIAPGSGAGTLNGSLGAGRGSGSDLFGNETNLNAGDSTTDSNVPSGARSSSTGENAGESTDNGAAIGNTPGAAEALKQAQDLARQEGKLPAESPGKDEDQQEQQRPHPREAAKSAGFFSVLPDSPAKVALVEIRQGRYDQALNHLNQLWALNPHALELQYLMGVACVMSQRPREAEEHYQRVLQSPLASGELKQLAYTGLKRLHSN